MNTRFENLEVYRLAVNLAHLIWDAAIKWDYFTRDTIGKQIVKSADSVGANIAEGSGRGGNVEFARFLKISRGSLFETKHWFNTAVERNILKTPEADEIKNNLEKLLPKLSAYINYIDPQREK